MTLPETPRWHVQHGHIEKARNSLRKVRDTEEEVENELLEIREAIEYEKEAISVATKIELINRLAKTGLTTIEAGSFVHPKWVPQVRRIPAEASIGVTSTDTRLDGSFRRSLDIDPKPSSILTDTNNIPVAITECQRSRQLLQNHEYITFST